MCHMCQEKEFNLYLDAKNNRTLPLDPTYPKHLSVRSPTNLPYEQTTALN
jgi:hypothetical protein